jgi:hypothetical protein
MENSEASCIKGGLAQSLPWDLRLIYKFREVETTHNADMASLRRGDRTT